MLCDTPLTWAVVLICILFFRSVTLTNAIKYGSVFTQDRYRSTYGPNTSPEETYNAWLAEDVPDPPFFVNETSILEQHAIVTSFLTNALRKPDIITVRCPFGWHPVGPFCTTLSVVPPYTQCPMDLKRFEIGPGNPVIPTSGAPGLCHRVETQGLNFQCPRGSNLVLRKSEERASSKRGSTKGFYICEMEDVVPYPFLRGQKQHCVDGFSPREDGCFALKHLPAEPSCPDDQELHSYVVDPYAFYGRQRLECTATTHIKGKLWCPEGYYLSGEPHPDIPFGSIIDSNISSSFQLSPEAQSLLTDGWLHHSGFMPLDSTFCFQVLTSLWTSCNTLQCQSRYLKHLRHVLINWGYLIQTDADFVVYLGIPSGRDFHFTNSGVRYNSG